MPSAVAHPTKGPVKASHQGPDRTVTVCLKITSQFLISKPREQVWKFRGFGREGRGRTFASPLHFWVFVGMDIHVDVLFESVHERKGWPHHFLNYPHLPLTGTPSKVSHEGNTVLGLRKVLHLLLYSSS